MENKQTLPEQDLQSPLLVLPQEPADTGTVWHISIDNKKINHCWSTAAPIIMINTSLDSL